MPASMLLRSVVDAVFWFGVGKSCAMRQVIPNNANARCTSYRVNLSSFSRSVSIAYFICKMPQYMYAGDD